MPATRNACQPAHGSSAIPMPLSAPSAWRTTTSPRTVRPKTSEAVKPPSSCDAAQAAGERHVQGSNGSTPPWASRLAGIDLRGAGRRSDQRQRRSRACHTPHDGKRRNLPARPSAPQSTESAYYEPATTTPSSVPASCRSSINWAAKHSSGPAEDQTAPAGPPPLNSSPHAPRPSNPLARQLAQAIARTRVRLRAG